ncbi:BglG family transcription antiterminator [Microbacterium faecale]|uniref:BglG family transcription antiterminator n=1 Tax=Microbacterium faecale TaxID=1804630 RepID=UPI00166346C7|nr:PTS sugar transporter subunit IIA [Microbacterium faecale]
MTIKRQTRVLGILLRRSDWVTAGYLADSLGVTARSVRSYVTAINRRAPEAIESGPQGYRATERAQTVELAELDPDRGTPRERTHALVRRLLETPDGVDVFDAALEMHVSRDTVESDLRRVRSMLRGTELSFAREAAVVRVTGTELARRRLVSRLVHEELDEGSVDVDALRRAAGHLGLDTASFTAVGHDLRDALRELDHATNELAVFDVVLHIAIAADRVARGHALARADASANETEDGVATAIGRIARERFGVELRSGDLAHLASLVMLSVVDPVETPSAHGVDERVGAAVRAAVGRAAETYGLRFAQEQFASRLALHVQNLVLRAAEELWSRNPMTRSLKAASPMLFDVAVSIAGDLSQALGIAIPDDEIADIAMHVGAALEFDRQRSAALSAALVSPGLEQMRRRLAAEIARAAGHEVEITETSTSYDPDWAAFATDLVLTTVDPPATVRGGSDRVVRIAPFLSDRDADRIADAANRVRRARRLSGLREEMARWFLPGAFVRDVGEATPAEIIRRLGAPLIAEGIIDESYIDSAIEREALSSTAFTESLAVPHAMTMSARRTAIAVAVSETAVPWGSDRVHVIALAAFSESDRPAFQTVFEQFVEVFADPANARRITRRATDRDSFLTELATLIDEG